MATAGTARKGASPKPEDAGPNPDERMPSPDDDVRTPDDRLVMAVGIPGFGLSIPVLTGLYGDLGWRDLSLWVGGAGFVVLAAAIWLGNRWLLFQQRRHLDWFAQPARKLTLLIAANVLYTVPVTVAGLWLWYAARGLPADVDAIRVVTLVNVICVVFVTHAYETLFLIREREGDMLRVERLERRRVEGELAALTAQIDPHFLFNSLNTLGHVIGRDPEVARRFCDGLAEVYRYVLGSRGRQLVRLDEELAFLGRYHELLALRFGAALVLEIDPALRAGGEQRIPPLALQTLLENAVKHNRLDGAEPLSLQVSACGAAVRFAHVCRPRTSTRAGTGLGLRNLDERCRLLTGRGLVVERSAGRFEVDVPVLAA